jgi:hypothetical protein
MCSVCLRVASYMRGSSNLFETQKPPAVPERREMVQQAIDPPDHTECMVDGIELALRNAGTT